MNDNLARIPIRLLVEVIWNVVLLIGGLECLLLLPVDLQVFHVEFFNKMVGIDMGTLIEVFEGICSVADGVVDYSVIGGEIGVSVKVVVGELGDLA
jgi:hypothetical protein